MNTNSFARAKAPLRPTPILGAKNQFVIGKYTETEYNFIPSHFTTIPTKLVKLVREKELTDCLNWISAHLGVNDEQAIAILKAWQRGVK
jgi:hypothetical protein